MIQAAFELLPLVNSLICRPGAHQAWGTEVSRFFFFFFCSSQWSMPLHKTGKNESWATTRTHQSVLQDIILHSPHGFPLHFWQVLHLESPISFLSCWHALLLWYLHIISTPKFSNLPGTYLKMCLNCQSGWKHHLRFYWLTAVKDSPTSLSLD